MRLKPFCALALGFGLLALAGCATVSDIDTGGGLPEQPIDAAPPPPPPADTAAVDETPPPPPPPPPPPELLTQSLAWEDGDAGRAQWSGELRAQIRGNLKSFDKASDIASFCPAYATLDADDKTSVLATLMVGIARYESGYTPDEVTVREYGNNSYGLYQIAYEDGFSWCALDRKTDSLFDPVNNIRCAVPKMARLVARDKVLAAGSTDANALGLARYWPSMRLGPGHHLDDIRRLTLNLAVCVA